MASLEPKDLSTKDKELWDAHVLALMTAYAKYAIRVMELASYERFKEGLLNHATDDDCRALLPKQEDWGYHLPFTYVVVNHLKQS